MFLRQTVHGTPQSWLQISQVQQAASDGAYQVQQVLSDGACHARQAASDGACHTRQLASECAFHAHQLASDVACQARQVAKKWWVESDFKAPNSRFHYGSKVNK
jgi:hypothetical protein